ncbi:MAG: hypothetical protein KDA80_19865 [Planctomycetaceae bacterium]|nr:hypothetical protein [Planctomycetaceae bacterium]
MWQSDKLGVYELEVFAPKSPESSGAIIFLSGFAGTSLQQQSEFRRVIEAAGIPVVRPACRENWWLDVVDPLFDESQTPMAFVRDDLTSWITKRFGVQPPQIALWGVSSGGQGVINLAYRHALTFPVVAAMAPALDFHIAFGRGFAVERIFSEAEAARQETAILHLHPLNWPKHQFFCCDPNDPSWYSGCERLASKLRSSGVPFECDLSTHVSGHDWTYFSAMAPRVMDHLRNGLTRL